MAKSAARTPARRSARSAHLGTSSVHGSDPGSTFIQGPSASAAVPFLPILRTRRPRVLFHRHGGACRAYVARRRSSCTWPRLCCTGLRASRRGAATATRPLRYKPIRKKRLRTYDGLYDPLHALHDCCCDLWSAVLPAVLLHYSRPSRTAPPASAASPMAASRAVRRAEKHEVLR